MAAVKGSKQIQMVVVHERPFYRFVLWCLVFVVSAALIYFSYRLGQDNGLSLSKEAVAERDELRLRLAEDDQLTSRLRQQLADVQVGHQIDAIANAEVRTEIEELQAEIADLREEIRFYKSVMMPGAQDKGLRVERLVIKSVGSGRYGYNLMLVQVVDKHDFVKGRVTMHLVGSRSGDETSVSINELAGNEGVSDQFRFRYFQTFDGEFTLPNDFEPEEVLVRVDATGRDNRPIERQFSWRVTD